MSKILAIDDELGFREALHHTFAARGHQVETAINTDHAQKLMASETFDLVVLDVVMPDELGIVLLKRMRAAGNRVPVVIYSVKVDAALEMEMRQAGADEVLHKSVSMAVLADRTEKILATLGKPPAAQGKGDKKRLLITDDESAIRNMLKHFFTKKGYEVFEASCGEKAVETIGQIAPDIMLLDMHMGSGMNGLETLKKIRQTCPKLAVVMATGDENDEMVRQAMEIGAYGYVLKPFDFLYLELVVTSKLAIAQNSS